MTADTPIGWSPLERFCELVTGRGVLGLDADEFMWMGRGVSSTGVTAEVYKHAETRHHLTLDDRGHAYQWRGAAQGFELTSLDEALAGLRAEGPAVGAAIAARWAPVTPAPSQLPPSAPEVSL